MMLGFEIYRMKGLVVLLCPKLNSGAYYYTLEIMPNVRTRSEYYRIAKTNT